MSPKMTSFTPCSGCKRACVSEFLGTYMLVLVGPGSVIIAAASLSNTLEIFLFVGACFGCTVAAAILLFGKISGAHIDPAVTVGVVSAKLLPRALVIPYLCFQLLGGLLAGLTLRLVFSAFDTAHTSLGTTKLSAGVSPGLGIILEATGTFALVTVALIVSTRVQSIKYQALLLGSTLFLLIVLLGPFTNASLNPARSLGPAVASGHFENLYVYFIGPILGALTAGIAFRLVKANGRRDSGCL